MMSAAATGEADALDGALKGEALELLQMDSALLDA